MHRGLKLPQNPLYQFSQEELPRLSFCDFKYLDPTDEELTSLSQNLTKDNHVYSRDTYDVGCTKLFFHINLKDDAVFKPERVTKVPIH